MSAQEKEKAMMVAKKKATETVEKELGKGAQRRKETGCG